MNMVTPKLKVTNVDARYGQVQVPPYGPGADTVMYGEPAGGRGRSVFLRDPEGNYVQLDQRA